MGAGAGQSGLSATRGSGGESSSGGTAGIGENALAGTAWYSARLVTALASARPDVFAPTGVYRNRRSDDSTHGSHCARVALYRLFVIEHVGGQCGDGDVRTGKP